MNKKIEKVLKELESSGCSSAFAVADHLRTVASNGPKYATPEAMRDEAEEVGSWADWVLKALTKGKPTQKFTVITGDVCGGLRFVGPFNTHSEAVRFAEDNLDQWEVAPIDPPIKHEFNPKEGDLVEP